MSVRAIDVGYGNVKYCQGEKEGQLLCGHFPSIASLYTGVDRGAGVMSKRDLVEVESGNSRYLVGRDSVDTLSARDDRGRTLLEDYIDMPQHLALLRGALAYIDDPHIDLLVSGLPVSYFAQDKEKMAERLKGEHRFPDGQVITVSDTWIIPQPVGGFINYFMDSGQLGNLEDLKSLTIDVGYYTVDWLVCRGLKMQEERSGSTAGGMSLILEKLAELISVDRQARLSDTHLIDMGIRSGFRTRIQGQPYDFSHLIPNMDDHITAVMQSVVKSVGSLDDIDVIVLVGGGASCYQKITRKLLNNRDIIVPGDSLYANVKGFYLAGQRRHQSAR
jgi:plasmid segregation protein ParM